MSTTSDSMQVDPKPDTTSHPRSDRETQLAELDLQKRHSELHKLDLESKKLQSELRKIELEVQDLARPWWRRPAYLQALGPTMVATFALASAWFAGYFNNERTMLKSDLLRLGSEIATLESTRKNLESQNAKLTEQQAMLAASNTRANALIVNLQFEWVLRLLTEMPEGGNERDICRGKDGYVRNDIVRKRRGKDATGLTAVADVLVFMQPGFQALFGDRYEGSSLQQASMQLARALRGNGSNLSATAKSLGIELSDYEVEKLKGDYYLNSGDVETICSVPEPKGSMTDQYRAASARVFTVQNTQDMVKRVVRTIGLSLENMKPTAD